MPIPVMNVSGKVVKTDSERLDDFFRVLKQEVQNVELACKEGQDYFTLGCSRINPYAAKSVLYPIYERLLETMGS